MVPTPIPIGPVGPVSPVSPCSPIGPVGPGGPDKTGVFPDMTLKTRFISLVRPEKFADKSDVVLISIEPTSIKFRCINRFTDFTSGSGFFKKGFYCIRLYAEIYLA